MSFCSESRYSSSFCIYNLHQYVKRNISIESLSRLAVVLMAQESEYPHILKLSVSVSGENQSCNSIPTQNPIPPRRGSLSALPIFKARRRSIRSSNITNSLMGSPRLLTMWSNIACRGRDNRQKWFICHVATAVCRCSLVGRG